MTNVALTPIPFGFVAAGAGVDLKATDWTVAGAGVTTVTFPNDGRTILAVNNGSGSALNVQPVLTRGVAGQVPTVPPYSLAAGAVQGFGPWSVKDYGANMTVNVAGAASVTVQAFEMTSA